MARDKIKTCFYPLNYLMLINNIVLVLSNGQADSFYNLIECIATNLKFPINLFEYKSETMDDSRFKIVYVATIKKYKIKIDAVHLRSDSLLGLL